MKNYVLFLYISFLFSVSLAAQEETTFGIVGEKAPKWEVNNWIDENGDDTEIEIDDYEGKVIVMLCFQHWCPGCHTHAFPMVKYLKDKYKRNDEVEFVAVQTVFEGQHTNTKKRLRKTQKKYKLDIPFGHDDGQNTDSKRSNIMQNYKTGGTPWFIIIDKSGNVVFNDYEIDVRTAQRTIKKALENVQASK